jgi:hypothetical protein
MGQTSYEPSPVLDRPKTMLQTASYLPCTERNDGAPQYRNSKEENSEGWATRPPFQDAGSTPKLSVAHPAIPQKSMFHPQQ